MGTEAMPVRIVITNPHKFATKFCTRPFHSIPCHKP